MSSSQSPPSIKWPVANQPGQVCSLPVLAFPKIGGSNTDPKLAMLLFQGHPQLEPPIGTPNSEKQPYMPTAILSRSNLIFERSTMYSFYTPQRVQLECQYGFRAPKTIPCMVLGALNPEWHSNWTLWAPYSTYFRMVTDPRVEGSGFSAFKSGSWL